MTEIDRRIRRSRRILQEGLASLLVEKSYERITVQDILDRADVGRSTFYAHFRDKEALLVACFDSLRDELLDAFASFAPSLRSDSAGPAAVVFHHAHRHRRLYKALSGKTGGHLVAQYLSRLIAELVRNHLRRHIATARSDLHVDVVAELYASATLGVLSWWIEQDFRFGPDRMARMHQQLTAPGLLAALGTNATPGGCGNGVWLARGGVVHR